MSDNRRATLHDVAQYCGVSYQTVSRVVNNHHYVADDTREKVLKAIAQLGYRPNRAAQSLAGNRTHMLGMLTMGIDHYGPAQVMIHTEQAALAAGYDLVFAHMPDSSIASLQAALTRLLHWQVDGLILITPVTGISHEDTRALLSGYSTVQVGVERGASMPSVGVDQYRGGELVADYLLSLGHRRIVELAGPADWLDASERHLGFAACMEAHGIAPVTSVYGDWSAGSGYESVKRLLDSGVDFTAIFSANDQMAVGVLRALQAAGLRVPDDVAVIGFDDIPEAAYLSPPLTTVRQDFSALGQLGIQYLLERIRQPDVASRQMLVAPELIVRESSEPNP